MLIFVLANTYLSHASKLVRNKRSICFEVKYIPKNVFQFSGVCLQIKYNQTCKIFTINRKILYKML